MVGVRPPQRPDFDVFRSLYSELDQSLKLHLEIPAMLLLQAEILSEYKGSVKLVTVVPWRS